MASYVKIDVRDYKDLRWYALTIWNVRRDNRRFTGTASPYRLHRVVDALVKRHGASMHESPRGKEPIVYRHRSVAGPKIMIVDLNEADPTLRRELTGALQ